MRKVALIFNPMSGQRHARRAVRIAAALAELHAAGVEADAVPTRGPGTAGEQAREAVAAGCDVVIACGGDGTAHEVMQGLVGSSAAMGVIPLGTANSLAADIGVPRGAAAAVKTLLRAEPVRVAAGKMEYQRRNGERAARYFTVAVGIGPDAHVFYSLNATAKRRLGYAAYYAEAMRIWATHSYPMFEVEYTAEDRPPVRVEASQLLAVRITDFGGLLRHLAPGAALQRSDLRLVLFRTQNRARYLQYVTAVMLGREPKVKGVELVNATRVECRPLGDGKRIHAEADGELLGTLPVTLSVAPDALTLLMPRR